MNPTLRRRVWLGENERVELLAAAHRALRASDPRQYQRALRLHHDLHTVCVALRTRPGQLVVLTRVGLRLPPDHLPVPVSNADVKLLIEHGQLPGLLRHLLAPPPRIFHGRTVHVLSTR